MWSVAACSPSVISTSTIVVAPRSSQCFLEQWKGCLACQAEVTLLLKSVRNVFSSSASGPPSLDHFHFVTSAARAAAGSALIASAAADASAEGSLATASPDTSAIPGRNLIELLTFTSSVSAAGLYVTSKPP